MAWTLYSLTFQLKSPLHVGFHKVKHFLRTRPYLTGKHLWAAITSKLTTMLGIYDYQKIGDFLKKTMRFGYLYPYAEGHLFLPKYTSEGLKFGCLPQNEFEKKFINSMTSASIDSYSLSAEEGMLHEIEFINPYTIDNGKEVFMKGLLWIKIFSENGISIDNNNDISFKTSASEISLKERIINRIQIGGEQKYGFGLLELKDFEKFGNKKLDDFPGEWSDENNGIKLELKSNDSIWSHIYHINSIDIKGNIEPLVGREWEPNKGAGRKLISHGLCWTPGSILIKNKNFKIGDYGIWEVIS